uniref:Uncharacterized protein n=1 Tax=Sphaerodactylus townsendi TaxID=933632 RepID=A0ACB8F348_9SAUR
MKSNFIVSVYAVYSDGISEACSVQSNSNGLLKKLPDGHADDDVGFLLGIGVAMAFLCFFLLALIAKKSFRQRVSAAFISVTPKWLLEDYPQVQKSSVIRLLQERNSSMMHNFNRLLLDYEDAVVTKVEEILEDKEGQKMQLEMDVPFHASSFLCYKQ